MIKSLLKLTALTLALSILTSGLLIVSGCATREPLQWYKGNLHTHTTFSDGDTQPEGVIQWYRDHGYDFLSITDHNYLLRVGDYTDLQDEGFILIPGNEISDSYDGTPLHLLALGLHDAGLKPVGGDSGAATLQNSATAIRQAGAVPVLAHPNFKWAFGAEEMTGIRDCILFEVLNAHPSVNNEGDDTRPSTEEMWDQVLSAGKLIYGIGTDDTHKIATYPGKSWVMIRAPELSEAALLEALEDGDFYVSTGVILDEYTVTKSAVQIRIRTLAGTSYTTSFIGEGGRVLARSEAPDPVFRKDKDELYVRARIEDSDGKLALTQPVFFHQ